MATLKFGGFLKIFLNFVFILFPFHFPGKHAFLCSSFLKAFSCPAETGPVDEIPNFPC